MRSLILALGIWGASCALDTDPLNPQAVGQGCPDGLTYCDGLCTDTETDPVNCSGCGRICDRGVDCNDGFCGGHPDSGTDAAGEDSGTDSGGQDAGSDAGEDAGIDSGPEPDAGYDAGEDAGTDGGEDAGTDSGPICEDPRCADCTVEQIYASGMIGCDGAETQCGASTLCGPGLHLCSFVEYRASGGSDGPSTSSRWLASCDRRICAGRPEDDIVGPTNDVCGTCDGAADQARTVAWICGGAADPALPSCAIGNFADASSRHLVSEALECLFAGAAGTSTLMGAACCPD